MLSELNVKVMQVEMGWEGNFDIFSGKGKNSVAESVKPSLGGGFKYFLKFSF